MTKRKPTLKDWAAGEADAALPKREPAKPSYEASRASDSSKEMAAVELGYQGGKGQSTANDVQATVQDRIKDAVQNAGQA
jgi:hypothetical protein